MLDRQRIVHVVNRNPSPVERIADEVPIQNPRYGCRDGVRCRTVSRASWTPRVGIGQRANQKWKAFPPIPVVERRRTPQAYAGIGVTQEIGETGDCIGTRNGPVLLCELKPGPVEGCLPNSLC